MYICMLVFSINRFVRCNIWKQRLVAWLLYIGLLQQNEKLKN